MRNFKTFIATALLTASGTSAFAQSLSPAEAEAEKLGYWPQPYTFIQVQGGLSTTFTNDKNFMDLTNPTFSFGVGRMFSPVVGARLHFNGYESSSILHSKANRDVICKYKYKYLTSDVDVMFNLTNLFSKTNRHLVDLYLIGGVGLTYAWDNDRFAEHSALHRGQIQEDVSNAWGKGTNRKDLFSHNVRAGLLVDVNVAKNLSVGVEADVNSLSDRFNSKYNNSDDWMFTGQVSLTYKFGHKPYEKKVVETPVTTQVDYEAEAAARAAAEAAAAAAAKAKALAAQRKAAEEAEATARRNAVLEEHIHFEIRASDPNNDPALAKAVKWAQDHPEKSITVTGYADKGTGNPRINKKYSQQRATKVADALKAQGIAADRIVVKSEGDVVQPHSVNDENRCAIIIGK